MRRHHLVHALCVPLACGGDTNEAATQAWMSASEDDGTASGGGPDDSTGSDTDAPGSSGAADSDDTAAPDDSGGDSSTGEPHFDCSPWSTTWIGAPCLDDGECSYEGGLCLREDEGFPCGTCSLPCEGLCPDLDGAPETFCIDAADVGLASAGRCLSKCDAALLGGNGCRDGYACAPLERYADPSAGAGVCVPEPFAPPLSACGAQLDALGAAWQPTLHPPEHPDGYPDLTCTIDEPVILVEPYPGVALRYVDSDGPAGVLLGCAAAVATAQTAEVAASLGAVEFVHYGTYNCRPIAGTSTLSQHAYANAIDIYGFTLDDGSFYTVIDDWEDFVDAPVTAGGSWLRDITDALWDMAIWNIILTPEYNDAHDNHVHVDLTPGENYYYWD
jgi:hypothetical protein